MIRSLTSQLFQQHPNVRSYLDPLFESSGNGRQQPPTDKLQEILKSMISKLENVSIILDALDESLVSTQIALLAFLQDLRTSNHRGLHILVTSRQEGELGLAIREWRDKEQLFSMYCQAANDDIHAYIRAKIIPYPDCKDWRRRPDLRKEVERRLTAEADGMFRYAACMLDSLKHCPDEIRLRQALDDLPRDLYDVYARILQGISDSDYHREATTILQFLTWSDRPMSVREIVDAIAVRPERSPEFKPAYRIFHRTRILEMCTSLVAIDDVLEEGTRLSEPDSINALDRDSDGESWERNSTDDSYGTGGSTYESGNSGDSCKSHKSDDDHESSICVTSTDQQDQQLRLAHSTVKEYFISRHSLEPFRGLLEETNAKTAIVRICLLYMSNVDYDLAALAEESTIHDTIGQLSDISRQFPFSKYCAMCWAGHAKSVEATNESIRGHILGFFNGNQRCVWVEVGISGILDYSWACQAWIGSPGRPASPLLFAAFDGLTNTTKSLLITDGDMNFENDESLHAAAYGGHVEVVELLLAEGAHVDRKTPYDGIGTCLEIATYEGHKGVVQSLLDRGADINATGGMLGTALCAAALSGEKDIVQILLDRGTDIDATVGPSYLTALEKTSSTCYVETVQLLLDHGADAGLALQISAVGGHASVVRILLEQWTGARKQDSPWSHDVEAATWSGNVEVGQLLLEQGADLSLELPSAASNGDSATVRILLDVCVGVDIDSRHPEYGSAIEAAAQTGEAKAVRILLNGGPEIGDALEIALDTLSNPTPHGHHDKVLRLLLEERNRQRMQYFSGSGSNMTFEKYPETDTEEESASESEADRENESTSRSGSESEYYSAKDHAEGHEAESEEDSQRWYDLDSE